MVYKCVEREREREREKEKERERKRERERDHEHMCTYIYNQDQIGKYVYKVFNNA